VIIDAVAGRVAGIVGMAQWQYRAGSPGL